MATDRFATRYNGIKLPTGTTHPYLLYGTAFKEDQVGRLTTLALKHGFIGVDTANYPTAYDEPSTGQSIQDALKSGVIKREELFITTKFTPAWAHAKDKVPYKTDQPIEAQVRESIEQSFVNLGVDYIDALLLHVPYKDDKDNLAAWSVMETYVQAKRVGVLGVSNIPLAQLKLISENSTDASTKPLIVQNRFQKNDWSKYDIELREYLGSIGGVYQAFYLLKTNEEIFKSGILERFGEQFGVTKEVAFYLLVLGLGNVSIVAGPASEEHMRLDVDKVGSLLGDAATVEGMRGYLGEFEELLLKINSGEEA